MAQHKNNMLIPDYHTEHVEYKGLRPKSITIVYQVDACIMVYGYIIVTRTL